MINVEDLIRHKDIPENMTDEQMARIILKSRLVDKSAVTAEQRELQNRRSAEELGRMVSRMEFTNMLVEMNSEK